MRWSQLMEQQPRLGQLGEQRLLEPGVVFAATIRRDELIRRGTSATSVGTPEPASDIIRAPERPSC